LITARYRGRFAPSPTGPLHFGSLVAAVASHADARAHRGDWLVRIEDVDGTRCRAGAEQQIMRTLAAHGMHADEPPIRQSARKARYHEVLADLAARGIGYRCSCSRKRIAAVARVGIEGPVYPGLCRVAPPPADARAAWRVRIIAGETVFSDRVCGTVTQDLAHDVGDFVVHRIDGYTAYQLAVVIDDNDQAITDVVRGADLLMSTPRQIWLQCQLGYPTPRYAHVPLVTDAKGRKLSKSDGAHPVDDLAPLLSLMAAWRHLGQAEVPCGIDTVDAFWEWAQSHWRIGRVPGAGRP
jgi:glutamyl-Q tRNA(Asp) synthetase